MSPDARKREKLTSIYLRVVSEWVELNIKMSGSIISVTNISISEDLGTVKILFSVWPDGKESDVLKSLENSKRELRGHIAEKIKSKFVPKLEFEIDESEKRRLHIEKLLKNQNKS